MPEVHALLEIFIAVWQVFIQHFPDIVGFAMPFFIQFLVKDVKSDSGRVWISIIVCFVVAALLHWQDLQAGNTVQVERSFGLIFVESHLVYKTWFKTTMTEALLRDKIDPKVSEETPPQPLERG